MPSYVSSSENRCYVALETGYGIAASVGSGNRIPPVSLTATQKTERGQRRDKTGSRTFTGDAPGLRRTTQFELRTYLSSWVDQTQPPAHGPLFQAALGGNPQSNAGAPLSSASGSTLVYSAAHGLAPGQAVSYGGEIRFVAGIVDANTVQLNAPFSSAVGPAATTGPTATYSPTTELASATIYDYWSPGTAVQRIVAGAAVNQARIIVNGDYQEFEFSGVAADLIDSSSFVSTQAGLSAFPGEPVFAAGQYSVVPGHLGQVWMGAVPAQFFTLTAAQITLGNDLDLRNREFGSDLARAIAPGPRSVSIDFSVFQQDDQQTQQLYQAARQRSPMSVMLQLGEQQGQLLGVYLKSVALEVPGFDDSQRRLQWRFQSCQAQGLVNDEVFVAFG
jgi:Phage tail tube protein